MPIIKQNYPPLNYTEKRTAVTKLFRLEDDIGLVSGLTFAKKSQSSSGVLVAHSNSSSGEIL